VKEVVLLDVTPLSLGVETLGGVMTKVIERNTTIPVRRSQIFTTAEDNQPAVDIHVLQGEREMARDNRTLGNFKLEGIPPGPRGTAQIEVTFDIDANGILNVSAKDKATGKEQKITISGSTTLSKEEKVEAFNQADSIAYQVERQLKDLGDRVPLHEKARAEQLIADIRQAIKDDKDVQRIKTLTSDLQQVSYGLGSAASQQAAGGSGEARRPRGDDDVVDAEFTEK
jgi:molecular chaperone DnaK